MPAPTTIRLARSSQTRARLPTVPFGLRAFEEGATAEAVLVLLHVPREWPTSGYGDVARVAAQLPDAASLPSGVLVVLLEEADGAGPGLLGRLLSRRRPHIARAIRGSALLARDFTHIGGGFDPKSRQDLVWGYARGALRA